MNIVLLLEERSMKIFLDEFLPRVLPEGVQFRCIPHEGKKDLEKSIPRKLRAWRDPNARFIVLRDQDNEDCKEIKAKLLKLCADGAQPDAVVRVVCRALESWYLADLEAVDDAFGTKHAGKQNSRKYREPQRLSAPDRELKQLVPCFRKSEGARLMAPRLRLDNDRAPSFRSFLGALARLTEREDG